MPPPSHHQNIFRAKPDRNTGDWIIYAFGTDGRFLNFCASSNLVPRVLSFPSPGARERREGEDPGNEVMLDLISRKG